MEWEPGRGTVTRRMAFAAETLPSGIAHIVRWRLAMRSAIQTKTGSSQIWPKKDFGSRRSAVPSFAASQPAACSLQHLPSAPAGWSPKPAHIGQNGQRGSHSCGSPRLRVEWRRVEQIEGWPWSSRYALVVFLKDRTSTNMRRACGGCAGKIHQQSVRSESPARKPIGKLCHSGAQVSTLRRRAAPRRALGAVGRRVRWSLVVEVGKHVEWTLVPGPALSWAGILMMW
ncbi:hypothetical protein CSOJ01_12051 [Colletotrichum sojae]|uniref:Uncharacterized protein n=1 Tax=Colletotrichum sojae TaxID=2175907 RepID=A0A8H6IW70_9PEZI|nr:hypothetical protein CSOJ01_12051 [Colletotrichum sojae]